MRRRAERQSDLFLIAEPPQRKLPRSERSRIVELLGELLWSVLEASVNEAAREEEARDE